MPMVIHYGEATSAWWNQHKSSETRRKQNLPLPLPLAGVGVKYVIPLSKMTDYVQRRIVHSISN